MSKLDLIGHVYGKLTVLAKSETNTNKRRLCWLCRCECGNTHVVPTDLLRSGKTKSCGCLRIQPKANKQIDRIAAIWKQLYKSTIIKRSKKTGKVCDISLEEFIQFSSKPCHYCGLPFSNISKDRRNHGHKNILISDEVVKFNGLDRQDNKKGYTRANVVPCCKFCNFAKLTMSVEDYLEFINRVYHYNFS